MLASSAVLPLRSFVKSSAIESWVRRMRNAVKGGCGEEALALFIQMKREGVQPNNFTFPLIANACAKLSNFYCSKMIHTHIMKSSFRADIYVQTAAIDMYVKCNEIESARSMFEETMQRDVTTWNTMLLGFAQLGHFDEGCGLVREMIASGTKFDCVTVIGLAQLAALERNTSSVRCIHCFAMRMGTYADVTLVNTFISAYAKCDHMDYAEMVFQGLSRNSRTVVSWNSLISGYAFFEEFTNAVHAYKLMLSGVFIPDLSSILNVLSSCVKPDSLVFGKLLHCHSLKMGFDSNICLSNTLISMYSKCREITSARYIFECMCHRSCISWTALIGGYAEVGDVDEALPLFFSMKSVGEEPDMIAFVSLITACAQIGDLDLGIWLDNCAFFEGLKADLMLCNALIDMYGKCGSVCHARMTFSNMPHRNIITWTSMISACALNGEFEEALGLFFRMMDLGLKPNCITFLAVLQACSHAGLLHEGWQCFNMMFKYGVKPGLDHYSCMVDLLCRRGCLQEALEFAREIPMSLDAGVWGAILGACKLHRDVEIGECAANRILELAPEMSAGYVEMANVYASKGKWDGAAKVRKMMKSIGVKKQSPGQSVILLEGKTHTFRVDDGFHSERIEIYNMMYALTFQLKGKVASSNMENILKLELPVCF